MIDSELHILLLILLVGANIVLSILIKAGLERVGMPSLIGYLALGFLLRWSHERWGFLSEEAQWVYEFLADLGIIVLLFRVGLESKLAGLLSQVWRASVVWLGNVVVSGLLGYVVSYHVLGIDLVPSLFVAIAFTATSLGVSVGVWQEAKALSSRNGELLLDVAEMDDISGIILMVLLFAVAPILKGDMETAMLPVFARTGGLLLLSLVSFGAFCLFFSRYLERPLTSFFYRIEPSPDPMLMVAGTGFIIAAVAGLLGFSVAIGAFFAGLVFSRDPQSVTLDASFGAMYELFSPFFFIGIGLRLDPNALTAAVGPGVVLVMAAIVGKVIGTSAPALMLTGWRTALLLGISMVPRAEIAMIIMQQGHKLGSWAVPPHVFAAMVLVSAVTCIFPPLLLLPLLHAWPQAQKDTA